MRMTVIPKNQINGVTLLEMMVSIALTALLILVVGSLTNAGSQWSTRIHSDLSTRRDGKLAIDYFERDISTITAADPNRMTLAIIPERVDGPGRVKANSLWIMMLNRPAATTEQGSIRTVSYRLVNADPMTPGGAYPSLSLYRTGISPNSQSDKGFLAAADLHGDYWVDKWPVYIQEQSGRALLDDFLLENVVDFKATVNYTYRDDSGDTITGSTEVENPIYWTYQGFLGSDIPNGRSPNTPLSITLTLTLLSAEGMTQAESGEETLYGMMRRKGFTVNRTFPIRLN